MVETKRFRVGPSGCSFDARGITLEGISRLLTLNYDRQKEDIRTVCELLDMPRGKYIVNEAIEALMDPNSAKSRELSGASGILIIHFISWQLAENGKAELSKYAVHRLADLTLGDPKRRGFSTLAGFCTKSWEGVDTYAIDVASKRGFTELLEVAVNDSGLYYSSYRELNRRSKYMVNSMVENGHWGSVVKLTSNQQYPMLADYATAKLCIELTVDDLKKPANAHNSELISYVCLNCPKDVAQAALDIAVESHDLGIVASVLSTRKGISTIKARDALMDLARMD